MMDNNLFGEPFEAFPRRKSSEDDKKKRRWENAFHKWSYKEMLDELTHYGKCGFGAICDYCYDNSYGRPCVRAFNNMCRDKRKTVNYDKLDFESAFDGEI